jgi:hypothetical protein
VQLGEDGVVDRFEVSGLDWAGLVLSSGLAVWSQCRGARFWG